MPWSATGTERSHHSGLSSRLVFIRMQPLAALLSTRLFCTKYQSSVARDGQQIGVWTKKLERFAPWLTRTSRVIGIACMEPRRTSWSSVRRRTKLGAEKLLAALSVAAAWMRVVRIIAEHDQLTARASRLTWRRWEAIGDAASASVWADMW